MISAVDCEVFPGSDYTPEELRQKGREKFQQDSTRWKVLDELAGEGGRLRTMPWYEYRGPNPYLFATQLAGSPSATWWVQVRDYFLSQAPVLAEPGGAVDLPRRGLARARVAPRADARGGPRLPHRPPRDPGIGPGRPRALCPIGPPPTS